MSDIDPELLDLVASTICRERWGEDGEEHEVQYWDRSTAEAVIRALRLTKVHVGLVTAVAPSLATERYWRTPTQTKNREGDWQWPTI